MFNRIRRRMRNARRRLWLSDEEGTPLALATMEQIRDEVCRRRGCVVIGVYESGKSEGWFRGQGEDLAEIVTDLPDMFAGAVERQMREDGDES